jgi:hypothetical protein
LRISIAFFKPIFKYAWTKIWEAICHVWRRGRSEDDTVETYQSSKNVMIGERVLHSYDLKHNKAYEGAFESIMEQQAILGGNAGDSDAEDESTDGTDSGKEWWERDIFGSSEDESDLNDAASSAGSEKSARTTGMTDEQKQRFKRKLRFQGKFGRQPNKGVEIKSPHGDGIKYTIVQIMAPGTFPFINDVRAIVHPENRSNVIVPDDGDVMGLLNDKDELDRQIRKGGVLMSRYTTAEREFMRSKRAKSREMRARKKGREKRMVAKRMERANSAVNLGDRKNPSAVVPVDFD